MGFVGFDFLIHREEESMSLNSMLFYLFIYLFLQEKGATLCYTCTLLVVETFMLIFLGDYTM